MPSACSASSVPRRRAALGALAPCCLGLAGALVIAAPAAAQPTTPGHPIGPITTPIGGLVLPRFTSSATEINPTSSTLDATNANGASGGRVNGLARAANGTTMFAATEWGGLWRSTDSGQNWSLLHNHLPHATFDVEVDPTNADRVYATSAYDGRTTPVSGINVSTDGGTTWTHPASATPPAGFCDGAARRDEPSAFGISIDPDNAQHVVIGTNCGVAITDDGGASWRFVDPTAADGADDVWDVVVHHGGIIDVCGNDGHRRSTDNGVTWTTAGAGGTALAAGRCSIAASPDESYVLFAVVGTTLRESDDGGGTWNQVFTNPNPQGRVPFVAINQRTGSAFDLWFGDVSLWRTGCTTPSPAASGGTRRCPQNTWTEVRTGGHADLGDVVFAPGAANDACPVLMASDGGVYRNTLTTNPGCQTPAWEQPTATPRALWLFGMDGANQPGGDEDLYFGNQDNGSFSCTDGPGSPPTWSNRDCCDSFDVRAEANRVVYSVCCWQAPSRRNRLFVRNRGMTGGGELNTYPAGNLQGFRFPDVIDRFGASRYVMITTSGVFITTNIGASPVVWTQLGAASTPAGARAVRAGVSATATRFYVLAGQADGRTNTDTLWRFDGTGAGTWTQVNPPGATGGFGVFAVDPSNPDRLIASHLRAGVTPQMIRSTDGGATWTNMTALDTRMTGGGTYRYDNERGLFGFGDFIGYPQPTLVAFDPEDGNVIVAGGADSGVFFSSNDGGTWHRLTDPDNPVDSGKPHIPRPRFAYFDHEAGSSLLVRRINVYIGSQGRGVWRIRANIPRLLVATPLKLCIDHPELCKPARLDRELIQLDCGGRRPSLDTPFDCLVRDRIPENCQVKFDCPGCSGNRLCPPWYQLFFEGLDLDSWDVALLDRSGDLVEHDLVRIRGGAVLSFRPTKESFVAGRIGDYELVFARRKGVTETTRQIRTRLVASDRPYAPPRIGTAPP